MKHAFTICSRSFNTCDYYGVCYSLDILNFYKVCVVCYKEFSDFYLISVCITSILDFSSGAVLPTSQSISWEYNDRSWMQFTIKCPQFEDKEEEIYEDLCYVTFSSSPPEV